jgi:hypothetical protein
MRIHKRSFLTIVLATGFYLGVNSVAAEEQQLLYLQDIKAATLDILP